MVCISSQPGLPLYSPTVYHVSFVKGRLASPAPGIMCSAVALCRPPKLGGRFFQTRCYFFPGGEFLSRGGTYFNFSNISNTSGWFSPFQINTDLRMCRVVWSCWRSAFFSHFPRHNCISPQVIARGGVHTYLR